MTTQTKKEKSKKASVIPENESPNQRFHRIVTHRCEVLGKAYNLIIRLPPQPAYEVTQSDAKALIEWVNKFHETFVSQYLPIANGENISKSGEKEVTKIF